MAKVLIATEKPFAPVAVEQIKSILKNNGHEAVLLEKYTDKSQLLDAVKDVEGIIIRSDKIDNEVFEAAKQLKVVVRAGAGYDNVDCEAATKHNVCVMNTPGQNSNAVAELVFGMLIYMVRGQFNGKSGGELKGRKLGLVAYGNVGRNVARIARGFEMDLYVYRFVGKTMDEKDIKLVGSLEELFKTCDIISLHAPSNADTKGIITYDLVSKMPKGGIIVNTARKEIVDEEGMAKALGEREDLRYATDIMPVNDEKMKEFGVRYFSTPKKMGAQTAEANINAGIAAANQVSGYINNGDDKFRVNK